MSIYCLTKEEWEIRLLQLIDSHTIFATFHNGSGIDYELLKPETINQISYNRPKPVTSLKSFFLPVRENVTSASLNDRPRIILGVPNCDIAGLNLLDEIYLDKDFPDIFFSNRRNNTLLISADCFDILEHCHCIAYNVNPYPTATADLAIMVMNGSVILRGISERGEDFIKNIIGVRPVTDNDTISKIEEKHKETETLLRSSTRNLPDYKDTGDLINAALKNIWEKYSTDCVSCGACTTICPTCTCFLLIDKPGFEKVKQMDACQYPGFERVAGGEDPLHELSGRFRNRYMCKYLWKPGKFKSIACTGCGRCIEACIGKISKNELFMELVK
jgi:sulfhydrogenase subunit beta (sulfur reductase)